MTKSSKIFWSGVLPIAVLLLAGTVFAGDNADVVLNVSPTSVLVKADTTTDVTIQVSVQGAVNVSTIGVYVEYDPSVVQVVDGELGSFLEDANLSVPLDTTKAGIVGVGGGTVPADTATAPDGDGVLATFTFSVTLAEDQETVLKVSEVQLLGVPASSKDVLTPEDLGTTITGTGVIIESLTITPSSRGRTSVMVGDAATFVVTARDPEGNAVDVADKLVWTADEALGILEAIGDTAKLAAATKAVVDAPLIAAVGQMADTVLVTLKPAPLAKMSLSITKPKIVLSMQARRIFRAGQKAEFKVAGQDQYGNVVTVQPVWSVENDDPDAPIGTISMLTGQLTAATTVKGLGNDGTVKAKKGAVEVSMNVRVMPGRPSWIEVEPEEVTVKAGESVDFSATVYDEYDNVVEGALVVWGVVGDIGEFVGIFGTFRASATPGTGLVVAWAAPAAFGGTTADVTAASKVTVVANVPTEYSLGDAYPNPFNPETTIRYALPKDEMISIVIYDVTGQEVTRLLDGVDQKAGYHSIRWDGRDALGGDVATGVYFYTVKAGKFYASKKMTVLR